MMKPVYISAASVVSPQQTFDDTGFLENIEHNDNGSLYIKDADYRKYINPVAIRRMSKMLKMGISTGMNALQQAGVEKPDAIITGTGRGSMVDTEQFLMSMIEQGEEALTPTSFIQSTYNSVNGWLALQTKSNGYNQTYVNRGTSFELALLDAQLFLNETDKIQHVLAGCLDEITPDYVRVKSKIGYWKNPPIDNLQLFEHSNTSGTIAGEGAAFFVLTNDKKDAVCQLTSIATLQDAKPDEVMAKVNETLISTGLTLADVDVLMLGKNGDIRQQDTYNMLQDECSDHTTITAFKHLCGEYDTSSGFATWLAHNIFKQQQVPDILTIEKGTATGIKNLLIVNHYILNSTSIILLQLPQ